MRSHVLPAILICTLGAGLGASCTSGRAVASNPDVALDDGIPSARDFSGPWVLDDGGSRASVPGRGGGSGAGTGQGGGLGLSAPPARVFIRQTTGEMVVEYTIGSSRNRITYRLDGRTVQNAVFVGGGGALAAGVFQSQWRADSLVTSFTTQLPRVPSRRYRELRWLTPDGTMIVEIVALDRESSARRSVYRRSPQ